MIDVPSFESATISTVLAWICVAPMLAYMAFAPFGLLGDAEIPPRHRILFFWLFLCLLGLSPLRYAVFQLALAASFPVQSWRALFTGMLALIYVPIVFGILYAISFGIPLAGTALLTIT